MKRHIKVIGMKYEILCDTECEYWEVTNNMLHIHLTENKIIIQTIGIPVYNIKMIDSCLKDKDKI